MLRTKGPIVVNITLTILFTVCVVAAGSVVAADTGGSLAPQMRLGQGGERAEQTVQPGARRTKVDGDYKPQIDCENLADSFIRVPDDVAAVCSRAVLNRGSGRAPTDTAYAIDIYPGSNFVNFILNNFSGQTTVGPVTGDFFAVDFDVAATTLYGIDDATQMLGTFDLTTGAFTAIGACVPTPAADTWTGLSIDMNNVAWASSTDGTTAHLYTVDLVTGAATHITTVPNLPLLIDIAMDSSGVLWGHDIVADSIYTIDTTTGAETLIGATGYDANYAQGMDFDYGDDTLYVFLYSDGTVWGTVDLGTGAVTSLDTHTSEFEGAIQVAGSENLGCSNAMVEFEDGIPLTFTVVDNAGLGVVWTTTGTQECPRTNETNGTGEAACVDTDTAGAIAYDTELVSNPFSLNAASAATLTASVYYYDVSTDANDIFEVDIWDGAVWNNLLHWDEDHQPEDISLDISAYAGLSGLQVRFTYSGDGYDWWLLVDDVNVDCSLPSITLTKTVGTDPVTCATTDEIVVAPGTDVTYCYYVENTGNIALSMHDLLDDQLGTILSGYALTLNPGESAQQLFSTTVTATVTNSATWTSYNPGPAAPTDMTDSTDTARVIVSAPAPVVCNGDMVQFDAGLPPDWVVADDDGSGMVWLQTGSVGYPTDCGEGNYTSGTGLAVGASSDVFSYSSYDTSLISPPIDLSGYSSALLSYAVNFQWISAETLDVDVSTDGGTTWNNLLRWQEDHPDGGLHLPPGENINLDLTAYMGNPSVLVRWRYYNPSTDAWDWYVVLDDVMLTCVVPVELQNLSVE